MKDNRIELEYLQTRDWQIYNIIKSGSVKEDTIIFDMKRTLQIKNKKSTKHDTTIFFFDPMLNYPIVAPNVGGIQKN
jgi:hypothetical protein